MYIIGQFQYSPLHLLNKSEQLFSDENVKRLMDDEIILKM